MLTPPSTASESTLDLTKGSWSLATVTFSSIRQFDSSKIRVIEAHIRQESLKVRQICALWQRWTHFDMTTDKPPEQLVIDMRRESLTRDQTERHPHDADSRIDC
jgi:hypothetical protein